eukprot:CAMPEP_0202979440 /NCGR_PEP_ID=MMETSP1396-20130829/85583_1 /ASSEMBLY_ACC=CAM_ASM_000872 /TAXON_ID= /ORGANISM="Pseudokeronopsis sp., Strain Brazil" /LENGTH=193 /DNA_ID=CAMNT_0049718853 /DNA_START=1273 /DNA_END=1851 /DNA_ORIENTATION=+
MVEVESALEKKRRELALRSDFNLPDAFKLFNSMKNHHRGIDCDDFFSILREVLCLSLTKDEMFILFYKLDRDGDGYVSYSELAAAFLPKQPEYAVLIESRKPFYGGFTSPKEYFKGETKEVLKKEIRAMIDAEVSVELIKQRIYQKIRFNFEGAFKAVAGKPTRALTLHDFGEFLKGNGGFFTTEKDLQLLFE